MGHTILIHGALHLADCQPYYGTICPHKNIKDETEQRITI